MAAYNHCTMHWWYLGVQSRRRAAPGCLEIHSTEVGKKLTVPSKSIKVCTCILFTCTSPQRTCTVAFLSWPAQQPRPSRPTNVLGKAPTQGRKLAARSNPYAYLGPRPSVDCWYQACLGKTTLRLACSIATFGTVKGIRPHHVEQPARLSASSSASHALPTRHGSSKSCPPSTLPWI